jgi:preprotein translocase subunit SecG
MEILLYVVFVVVCALLILLVLIQQGKGAGVGFSMGGASQAMFGGSGGRDVFIKVTAGLAAAFMVICIILAKMAVSDAGQYHGALAGVQTPAPAAPASAPAVPGGMPGAGAPLAAQAAKPLQAAPVGPSVPASRPAPVAPAPAKQ